MDTEKWSIEVESKLRITGNRGALDTNNNSMQFSNWLPSSKLQKLQKLVGYDCLKEHSADGKCVVEIEMSIQKVEFKEIDIVSGCESLKLYEDDKDLVSLIVEKNRKVKVERKLLCAKSKFFESKMSAKRYDAFQLDNTTLVELNQLLAALRNQPDSITDVTIDTVLKLADRFEMDSLIENCEKFLIAKSAKRPKTLARIAVDYQLGQLKAHLRRNRPNSAVTPLTFACDTRQSKIEKLEEALICTVCYDMFKEEPKTLDCGHVFCEECIRGFNSPIIRCPMCRKVVDATVATPNYVLKRVLEVMKMS
ncbi:hypothetical protein GCK72_016269 [Caenorhabditis remanei]|uniref:RING-type domain-containing protein n=1 Tax=Caenorhabditis remanei TaxID=31234 RepID=A0A6A5GZS1_CAERE|nr:hypothetical protein GCK72_016269 [Caenorhabditis remanei]KAF1759802.1 hypothetical protein GCK72_016269 [Caenorhabditis remanei]